MSDLSVTSSLTQPSIYTGASGNGPGAASGVQPHRGHHHRKSVSDQVDQMSSAIDSAVKAGTMTGDQATTLKKELADITQTLGQANQASGTGTSSPGAAAQSTQTNPLSQLSDADRKKIFGELQDVRQQLHAANNPQGANQVSAASSSNDAISNLFSQIDSDKNGSISQSEFTQFLAKIGMNTLGYNSNATSNATSGAGSTFSVLA